MEGIGQSLMEKMGWKKGEGLGAEKSGPLVALSVGRKRNNQGVGAKRKKAEIPWWDKMMTDAYGKPKDLEGEGNDILEACEGRRCRPHGSAKLARIAAQEDGKGKRKEESIKDTEDRKEETEKKRKKKKKRDDKVGKEVELRVAGKKIKKSKKKSKSKLGKKSKKNEEVE